jgi:response regulator of citrate/malate metabolism
MTSGYDATVRRFLGMGFVGYIIKPYGVDDLGRAFKSILSP